MDAAPLSPHETACYQVLHQMVVNHLRQGMSWPTLLTIAVRLLGHCVVQSLITRSLRTDDLEFLDAIGTTLQAWVAQPPTHTFGLVELLDQAETPDEAQAASTLWTGLGRVLTEYREAHLLTVWHTQRVALRLLCNASAEMSDALAQDADARQHCQQVLQEGWRTLVRGHLHHRRTMSRRPRTP